MKYRSEQDLLAERRANVQEMRREHDPMARALLNMHVAVIDTELARRVIAARITGRRVSVDAEGDRFECTWEDFAASNGEGVDLDDVARSLVHLGYARLGGGAAPYVHIEIVEGK